ncbi:hypothetical protein E5163_04575 [Marinicauda algicola]|uniref:Uncharacterized protein n=1 Tax=Marinicauda algicola TaxID=2029849 RepID=A0A4S2H513_9PROT|nr:hypothetical protein [Marinicauda algicola]TGY90402.1 hypothetical protein E5163_04575 [Marinicauda algicola]
MHQILTDELAMEASRWSHVLHVDLPEIAGRERLVEHVDRYVQLYLQAFPPLKARHARLGPAVFALDAEAMSAPALDAVRSDLASRIFAEEEAWRVRIEPQPGAHQAAYEPYREPGTHERARESAGPAQESGEGDVASELARFREDMRAIAGTLTGHEALRESVERFRGEIDELCEAFSERVTHAAHAIEHAARRVEASAAMIPDPDRLELVLTRNEASAAILERGVRQSLSLLLQAVETMAEKGALPRRDRLSGPDEERRAG